MIRQQASSLLFFSLLLSSPLFSSLLFFCLLYSSSSHNQMKRLQEIHSFSHTHTLSLALSLSVSLSLILSLLFGLNIYCCLVFHPLSSSSLSLSFSCMKSLSLSLSSIPGRCHLFQSFPLSCILLQRSLSLSQPSSSSATLQCCAAWQF